MIWLDFETRSECDLKRRGVYNYARHPSTQVLVSCYAVDDGEVQTGLPDFGAHQIRAHNAAFERLILQHVLGVNIPLERFYCTAAQARANSAPGSLEDAARFMGGAMQKDRRGAALVRSMCSPPFTTSPDMLRDLTEYCAQDVRAMRELSQSLRELTAEELGDYHVNERINARGVRFDTALGTAATNYAGAEELEIQADTVRLTGCKVRSGALRQWIVARLPPSATPLITTAEGRLTLDKGARVKLLDTEIPADVRDVLQNMDDLSASSVSKFVRMSGLADEHDHRIRGAFTFAGGAATGRASSLGAQVHNFSRKATKNPDEVRDLMVRGEPLGPGVMNTLRGMLRPSLIPAPGKKFIVADWAAIEARMNPWLSKGAEDVLDVFRSGRDIYEEQAAGMYHVSDISPELRQIGKVAVLACGYGGGANAFASMGRNYGIRTPPNEAAAIVTRWRHANQWAVRYWSELEQAYTSAMREPGEYFEAARVMYHFDGAHLWYALPSGRILRYPFARIEDGGITYAKSAWTPAADAVEWPRARLWKGLACENICQAAANDVLRHALRQLENVVLHVHDEIVAECDDDPILRDEIARVMCTPPAWAEGLPLNVSIKLMSRYGK